MLWGAITQKETATNQVPSREEYEKLRWFSCPDTYAYKLTAHTTSHDDTYLTGVLSAGEGKGRVSCPLTQRAPGRYIDPPAAMQEEKV